MRQLGGIDSMFVRAETPSMHLHVVGVQILAAGGVDTQTTEGVASSTEGIRERIRSLVRQRLPLLPPFRWRLIEAPGGLGAPCWIEDPEFDLDRHIRCVTLPEPGSRVELERFVAEVAGRPLARDRPLWEMHLVDGLHDGSLAVVAKLHHAFMDGGAGSEVMASLFDLEPGEPRPAPSDPWRPDEVPSGWRLATGVPGVVLARVGRLPAALSHTTTGMGGLLGAMFPGAEGGASVSAAPRTPFNGPLTSDRVVALADCSLAEVKRVKSAFGVTVNDVVLAAVASALRAELRAIDALGDLAERPLVVAVPVSVRPSELEREFGNHTSAMMVPLPAHIDDPVERLSVIHDLAIRTKERHRAMGSELLEVWAGLMPPWLVSVGARALGLVGRVGLLPPVFNAIVSNVPGPPIPLYLAGIEVSATYPLGPLIEGVGLNITVLSQRDTLHIGLIAEPGLVAHPEAIATGVAAGVDELLALASPPRERSDVRPTSGSSR